MHAPSHSGSAPEPAPLLPPEEAFFIALARLGGKRGIYAESFSAADGAALRTAASTLAGAALRYVNEASGPDGEMTAQVLSSATRSLFAAFLLARTTQLPTDDPRWYENIFLTVDLGKQLGSVAALAKVMGALNEDLEGDLRRFFNPDQTPDKYL